MYQQIMKEVLDNSQVVFEEEGVDLALLEELKQVGISCACIASCGIVCPAPCGGGRLLAVSSGLFSCQGLLLAVGRECALFLVHSQRAHC